jgi:NAD(P)-dependent dehydrogenase (short-subunit alcohol dehydrogenase family)
MIGDVGLDGLTSRLHRERRAHGPGRGQGCHIVTGGASGIGAACATTLASEGAKVVVTDLDDPRGHAVVGEIGRARGEAVYLHQDVSLEESWPGIIETAQRRFGRLDVIVANAGIGSYAGPSRCRWPTGGDKPR